MRLFQNILIAICAIGSLNTCVKPFEIETIGSSEFLVVEGFLSDQFTTSQIKLSRSTTVDDGTFPPESGATIRIESNFGPTISFSETEPGLYTVSSFLAGSVGNTYQLFIETQNGNEYSSDPVIMRKTPPIDRLYGTFTGGNFGTGLYFFLDTEDPFGETHFYRWEWVETYEINTPFPSKFDWVGGNDVIRREFFTDHCWPSQSSQNIIIKSTLGLGEDKVNQLFIRYLPSSTDAMRIKYSLMARQFSLSQEAYQFWDGLKTINENQGTLFDVQPSAVRGNIHSLTDENEIVLGYFDAAEIREVREFFVPEDFADQGFSPIQSNLDCVPDTVAMDQLGATFEPFAESSTPLTIFDVTIAGWLVLPQPCTDCSKMGTIFEPDFWE